MLIPHIKEPHPSFLSRSIRVWCMTKSSGMNGGSEMREEETAKEHPSQQAALTRSLRLESVLFGDTNPIEHPLLMTSVYATTRTGPDN
mmetsp:Transcript_30133/g.69548  ORF Transcript_30133/g.69548 Transcript_30133/m.69548 type:complete len:88 (+) Transcript_30133:100-363(+)